MQLACVRTDGTQGVRTNEKGEDEMEAPLVAEEAAMVAACALGGRQPVIVGSEPPVVRKRGPRPRVVVPSDLCMRAAQSALVDLRRLGLVIRDDA